MELCGEHREIVELMCVCVREGVCFCLCVVLRPRQNKAGTCFRLRLVGISKTCKMEQHLRLTVVAVINVDKTLSLLFVGLYCYFFVFYLFVYVLYLLCFECVCSYFNPCCGYLLRSLHILNYKHCSAINGSRIHVDCCPSSFHHKGIAL